MKIKELVKDIRFWIAFFFLVRLVGITNPPLEVGHNWRQTTVTMPARNFLEIDNNILYPRLDIAGEKTGITGMEFPALNYIIYLVSAVFGYEHWYGRLINLLFSSLGLLFFYKLIKKHFSASHALYATLILIVSIWFQFSRKIMPDTFAMSMVIASMYYASNYFDNIARNKNILPLFAYLLLMTLGVLCKLSTGYALVILGIFMLDKTIPLKKKVIFCMVSVIGIIPVLVWYFYWVPQLVETYGFWHFFMGKSFALGSAEIWANLSDVLSRFYDTSIKYVGFLVFILGLIFAIIKKEKVILLVLILGFLTFSIIVLKAGINFSLHNYYVIPFVPIMAFVAGYGLTKIKNTGIVILLLSAIAVEGISNQHQDFSIHKKDAYLITLESDLDTIFGRDELIVINSDYFPTPMYFAHRKGWICNNAQIENKKYIQKLKTKGLKYLVVLKRNYELGNKFDTYKMVLETSDYIVYQVSF
jgi:4-amino-4-deoxy-L-arabinose transferase-like glycosyltransferase